MSIVAPHKNSISLVDLPPELVTRIIEEIHPSTHFDLGVTCKYLWACSREVVRRHRQGHARHYGICYADISPATVPELLRQVIADPITGYYIREFEIWGSRELWEDWDYHRLYKPEYKPHFSDQTRSIPCAT